MKFSTEIYKLFFTKMSRAFYQEFIHSNYSLSELAQIKGIKCSTAQNYVSTNYDRSDAKIIMKKLGLDKQTIANAYKVLVETQQYRAQHPSVESSVFTPYIHKALGERCTNCYVATYMIRRLYQDLCDRR